MIQLVRELTPLLHLTLGAAFGNIAMESKAPLERRSNHRACNNFGRALSGCKGSRSPTRPVPGRAPSFQ